MRRGILADSSALFGLAFAAAPPVTGLASPHTVTRWVILQEARPQTLFSLCRENHCPRTARRHTVSGTISLPFRGAFHLSLTVLVHYRSLEVFSLGEWTPPLRTGLACPVLLRCSTRVRHVLLRDFHPLWSGCPDRFKGMTNLSLCVIQDSRVLQPLPASRQVWAAPRSLATTSGIVSVPRDTRMFRFSRCPSSPLWIRGEENEGSPRWVSPFGNSRIWRLQTAPRDFSQSTASFFGL